VEISRKPAGYSVKIQSVTFLAATTILTSFLGAAVFFTMPSNIIANKMDHPKVAQFFNTVAPENWAFFTRDPQGETFNAYRPTSDGRTRSLLKTPQARTSNLFGLSRTQRAQGVELGALVGMVSKWQPCAAAASACLAGTRLVAAEAVHNISLVPTLCGEVLISVEKPVPWNYRDLDRSATSHITRSAHVEVKCDRH